MPAASVRMTWSGDRIAKEIKAELNDRLRVVGELVTGQIKRNLSEPGPAPSLPGEFPHAQSGYLRAGVTYHVDSAAATLRIIVPAEYAGFLEDGTSRMKARPFLRRTIRELRPKIKAIMAGPRKGFFTRLARSVVNLFRGDPADFTETRE